MNNYQTLLCKVLITLSDYSLLLDDITYGGLLGIRLNGRLRIGIGGRFI